MQTDLFRQIPATKSASHALYVLLLEGHRIKVGHSHVKSVEERIKVHRRNARNHGNGRCERVFTIWPVGYRTESEWHCALLPFRVPGCKEIFLLTEQSVSILAQLAEETCRRFDIRPADVVCRVDTLSHELGKIWRERLENADRVPQEAA